MGDMNKLDRIYDIIREILTLRELSVCMLVRIQKDKNKKVRREKAQPQDTEKVYNTTEPYKYVVYFCIQHEGRKRKNRRCQCFK